MKYAMIAAIVMTLPAIAGLVAGFLWGNQYLVYAALASLALNSLPFLVAGIMMRKADPADLGHHD